MNDDKYVKNHSKFNRIIWWLKKYQFMQCYVLNWIGNLHSLLDLFWPCVSALIRSFCASEFILIAGTYTSTKLEFKFGIIFRKNIRENEEEV